MGLLVGQLELCQKCPLLWVTLWAHGLWTGGRGSIKSPYIGLGEGQEMSGAQRKSPAPLKYEIRG